ncbi:probable proline--tRNA ligase, mitochondrial isoform X2 [Pollicipes pollicipes]|uniref:probable proline--tRNA ligase, mitochondrial isoform X2 n=1 Tax=Pollicipes pollicipes TaxID=41117 RepID=UPI001885833E|nr:probable proline--tRNA ligase, mitochondrial isoform X2 [Pollicipes pollicipes]
MFLFLPNAHHMAWQRLPHMLLRRSLHARAEPFSRVSQIFQPIQATKKLSGRGDEVVSRSFELLTAAGYIHQSSGGVFHILPLCQRVLDKMVSAVHQEMAAIGAGQLTMPTLVRDTLWKQTGRAEQMGAELMTVEDRSGHRFVLSPTHEEAVTQLVGAVSPVSSRQLPLRLYQVTAKFRDEKRARFGLLRCKEFLMKDLYTFDATEEAARASYREVVQAYTALFLRLGIPAVRVRGDSGLMGGRLSHEFHVLAPVGEDRVLVQPECEQPDCPASVNLEVLRDQRETAPGARAELCQACGRELHDRTGIEVAHTFLLGQLYSEVFGACCSGPGEARVPLHMGCYGIGLSRLLAAVVEARSADGAGLSWPAQLAPYKLCVVTPKVRGQRPGRGRGVGALQVVRRHAQEGQPGGGSRRLGAALARATLPTPAPRR